MNAITKDNYEDNIKLILRCHGYEPRTFEDFHTCYDCKKVFGFDYEDVYKSCDTIDGQYTEFDAIRCPHCLIENRW
ncbi:MAG TPA: hypothetical protein DCS09_08610 [Porphyromonadaceae bacterium]|nr:hypothetical protein [Porphyromonadaceae bacterium]